MRPRSTRTAPDGVATLRVVRGGTTHSTTYKIIFFKVRHYYYFFFLIFSPFVAVLSASVSRTAPRAHHNRIFCTCARRAAHARTHNIWRPSPFNGTRHRWTEVMWRVGSLCARVPLCVGTRVTIIRARIATIRKRTPFPRYALTGSRKTDKSKSSEKCRTTIIILYTQTTWALQNFSRIQPRVWHPSD